MSHSERGTIQGGKIVLTRPIGLQDGTEVVVQIEPIQPGDSERAEKPFQESAFFGMRAGSGEDGAAWVRREREKWQLRSRRD